uniref:Guanine nucleotide-binding protein subunit beta-like protein n=1 Tax=Percolomonas cosmopolitus TaxID=63605 RepID=A0A7S1KSV3_9EUKA|mmetsp:Transcript_8026/g.29831  ORF Transcript_8026/g.29831 Transcript_8026/m.29831 type:complete len:496 (+) Transcript_8026:275-1762(+)|eukprot:CAMPEP_0117435070 /NCGR_PEP_ID=MMETSP0759-20121206/282_1 /TAXON_ID=63605 /ORGANISM="Percolomonas cosmopolitus, Strain WS" /LENGTH=495 /DNA_ID=CAMNT_0005226587 /DNA_START=251 /DNA_END=1738 /DNA_ORIENTATION=+
MSHSEDPQVERTFRGHHQPITSVSFSPDLKRLASTAMDSALMLWNFKPSLRAYRFIGHDKGGVMCCEYAPSGAKLIASGGKDRTIRLWTPTVKGQSVVIKGHSGGIRCVSFTKDARRLLSASDDKTLKLWSVKQQKFITTMRGHSNWVRSAQWSPDARLVVSGSDDKTVRLWDTRSLVTIHQFFDHTDHVNCVRFHPDGTCVAACSDDQSIKLWDIRTNRLLQHYSAHQDAVNDIAFHPSGNFLLSGSSDGFMKVWDLREGHLYYTLSGHQGPTTAVTFSPDGDFFASGGADNLVMVWKTNFDKNLNEPDLGEEAPTKRFTSQIKDQNAKMDKISRSSSAKRQRKLEHEQLRRQEAPAPQTEPIRNGTERFESMNYQPPPLDSQMNPQLAQTLEHIIRQMDVLTQTVKLVEERLSMTEIKLSKMEQSQHPNINLGVGNGAAQQQPVRAPQRAHSQQDQEVYSQQQQSAYYGSSGAASSYAQQADDEESINEEDNY